MKRAGLLVWTVGLSVAAVALLRDARWPDSGEPATAVMSVIAFVAGAMAAYLVLATVAAVVAETTQSRVLGAIVGRLTTAGLRRAVAVVISGGLLASPVTSAAEVREPPAAETPILRRVPGDDMTRPSPGASPAPVAAPAPTPTHPSAVDLEEIVAAPGDHLWAIAERVLATRLGRPPTDAEIVPFWRAVIDLNRDRLASGDPDLIFAGQRFLLPS